MKTFNIFTFIFGLISLCYAVKYKPCNPIKNDVDRCECYIRSETDYYGGGADGCGSIKKAKTIVRDICKTISYCRDAYAHNDDFCPKASFNYGTNSCRKACLKAIQNEFKDHNEFMCLYSKVKNTEFYCADEMTVGRLCHRGWRKEL